MRIFGWKYYKRTRGLILDCCDLNLLTRSVGEDGSEADRLTVGSELPGGVWPQNNDDGDDTDNSNAGTGDEDDDENDNGEDGDDDYNNGNNDNNEWLVLVQTPHNPSILQRYTMTKSIS